MRVSQLLVSAFGLSLAHAGLDARDGTAIARQPPGRRETRLDVRSDLEVRSLIDTVWQELKSTATCASCMVCAIAMTLNCCGR
jgi:hypothetical protein